jgi:hypothetical protein
MPFAQRLVVGGIRRAFAARYLRSYRRMRRLDPLVVRAWRLPIMVVRLGEGIEAERGQLLRIIRGEMA